MSGGFTYVLHTPILGEKNPNFDELHMFQLGGFNPPTRNMNLDVVVR